MRTKTVLIPAMLSIALAACGTTGTSNSNTSLYSVHQPVVERSNYMIDLATDGLGIRADDQRRMNEWIEALQLGYGDRIAVDYGNIDRSVLIKRTIADAVADRGVLMNETAPVTAGPIAPGSIRVIISRSRASVPTCPDWSTTTDANYNASSHSNFGCAINSNLAAMVADPEDLVRGREDENLERNAGAAVIKAHRTKTNGGN